MICGMGSHYFGLLLLIFIIQTVFSHLMSMTCQLKIIFYTPSLILYIRSVHTVGSSLNDTAYIIRF